jgi:hypothetical protein
VYRGTRIPAELIADMLIQGTTPEEIREGYPALDRERVELAPLYVQVSAPRPSGFPPVVTENLVCMPTPAAAKTDRGYREATRQYNGVLIREAGAREIEK